MKLTTQNIGGGRWRIVKDGVATVVVVGKEDAPKFGMRQEWAIGIDKGSHILWLAGGIPGKALAVDAIASIARMEKV